LKGVNAAIADFERLEAASSSPKLRPMGNVKSGILFHDPEQSVGVSDG
jgi:hypothetical protein